MDSVQIHKGLLSGTIQCPPSKSAAHRAIICAALSDGTSVISNIALSEDILATIKCMSSLGAEIVIRNDTLYIDGITSIRDHVDFGCNESGSTLRFIIPIAAALGVPAVFTGKGKLPFRPIDPYLRLLPSHGVHCEYKGKLPLKISGQLSEGIFEIPGDISSQFITGLLFALPLLKNDSEIVLTSPLESCGYVDMTIETLSCFGIDIQKTETGFHIKGSQQYKAVQYSVEGDWSQAAFYIAAGAIGGNIKIEGLNKNSVQGDKAAFQLFKDFGASLRWQNDSLIVSKGWLKGIDIDATNIPDLVPILAVTAVFASGQTNIHGIKRLKIKESDRIKSVVDGLLNLGVNVLSSENTISVLGRTYQSKGNICGYNDHRIVMAFSIAATAIGTLTISDKDSVNKSYPGFFNDFMKLGGKADVV